MRPLQHLTNEDLSALLKEEIKKQSDGVKKKLPTVDLLKISGTILEIASELITRVPKGSRSIDLDK